MGALRIDPELLKALPRRLRIEIAENSGREDFKPSAMVRIKRLLEPYAAELARERRDEGRRRGGKARHGSLPENFRRAGDGETRDHIGAIVGCSGRTLDKATAIVEAAEREPEKYGDLARQMDRTGKIDRLHKHLGRLKARAEAEARAVTMPPGIDLSVGDIRDVLASLREEVDAIITDPPYGGEWLPLYAELGRLAKQALKADGTLAIMTGQAHLLEFGAAVAAHVPYRWTVAFLHPGPQRRMFAYDVATSWKPVLVFGGARGFMDVVTSPAQEKALHDWQQSESGMAALVEQLTKPGDLVCDPFLGVGTTAVVCARLARRFIGCDIDEGAVAIARGRIAEAAT